MPVNDDIPVDDPVEDEILSDEEEVEQIRSIGAHPMLAPIQQKLLVQLKTEENRLNIELLDIVEGLKREKRKREDTGVSLYSTQQQLAKLQLQLESTIKEHASLADTRSQAEEQTTTDLKKLEVVKREVEVEEAKVAKFQKELDRLHETMQLCEKYNESMKGEIALARRVAYKTEENVSEKEKKKGHQDLYIAQLTERIKSTRESFALYKAQLVSQQQETRAAASTLKEAFKEMEAISFEKKQLMSQWKTSLVGIQRRDEALAATREAIDKQKQSSLSTISETKGVKSVIKTEQVKNEDHTAAHDKVVDEIQFLKKEVAKLLQIRSKLEERYVMLRKSLEQTDAESKRVELERKNVEQQIDSVSKNIKIVDDETRTLEIGVAENISTQTTVSKAAQNLAKNELVVRKRIHEKEKDIAKMENEISRNKVQALNVESENKSIRSELDKHVEDLKMKDLQIAKYEQAIRVRNDTVEKKMNVVQSLNRKLEKLAKDGEVDETNGPLEAAIKSYKSDIVKSKEEQEKLKRRWLNIQRELVTATADVEALNSDIHAKTSEQSILEQRRLRMDRAIEKSKTDVVTLRKEINEMHKEMNRLNILTAKNKNLQEKLASETFNLENEFVAELRELEKESLKRDAKVRELVSQRKQFIEELADLESQAMIWQKRYTLEADLQKSLDPTVGTSEIASMKLEVHRMKLRYTALKREQESMIKDMEIAIEKRESIATRNRGRHSKKGYTKQSLKHRIQQLKKMLKSTAKDTAACEEMLAAREGEIQRSAAELEQVTREQEEADAQVSELQKQINECLFSKQRISDANAMCARMLKRYKNIADGNAPKVDGEENGLIGAEARRGAVLRVIKNLQQEFPQFNDVLARVGQLTNIKLPV
eukprot:g5952.t1